MYEFWYGFVTPKYWQKKLCYLGTYSFIVYIKTDDVYVATVEDVETRFDTSKIKKNYWINERRIR